MDLPSSSGSDPVRSAQGLAKSAQVELLQQQRRQTRLQCDVRNLIKRSRILAGAMLAQCCPGPAARHGWPGQGTVKLSREEQQGQQRSEGPMLAWLSAYGAVSESMLVRASGCSCWSAVTSAVQCLHAEPDSEYPTTVQGLHAYLPHGQSLGHCCLQHVYKSWKIDDGLL